jgi:hypothetical protein
VDPKTLPKGSAERKEAVAAQRRAHAARIRAKKAKQQAARAAAGLPLVPAAEGEAFPEDNGQESLREAVRLVLAHLGEPRWKPPTRLSRAFWQYAKENQNGFMDKYVPMLLKGEKADKDEEQERKRDRSYVVCTDRLERFLAETTNVVQAGPQGSAGQLPLPAPTLGRVPS